MIRSVLADGRKLFYQKIKTIRFSYKITRNRFFVKKKTFLAFVVKYWHHVTFFISAENLKFQFPDKTNLSG